MARLLIVDDDSDLFSLLKEYLEAEGFSCGHAEDGASGLALLASEKWDMAILDVMLPGMDGLQVLQQTRSIPELRSLPILMLTARGEETDKVTGLEMGADDYLAKPFSPRELLARLKALLRRAKLDENDANAETFLLDDLLVHKTAMFVEVGGERIPLTASEMRLMNIFMGKPGTVMERTMLYQELFGHPPFPRDRGLDMMISRLRKKLGPRRDGGERIRSARGEGYVFLNAGDAP